VGKRVTLQLAQCTVYGKRSIGCAKTAEPIELPFGTVSGVSTNNRVLDGRAHWCYLVNTVEQLCAMAMSGSATRGGDAVCSQIALGSFITD